MEISRRELRSALETSFETDVFSKTPLMRAFEEGVKGLMAGGIAFGAANILMGGNAKMAVAETFAYAAGFIVHGYKTQKAAQKVYNDLTTVTTVTERPDAPEAKPAP